MQQLIAIQNYPVDGIKIGRSYQRALENSRLANIVKSISQQGFWPWEAIVVNQDYYVIDGQHRAEAAKKLNIQQIPVSVVKCENEKEEAALFEKLNSFNTRLSPIEFWHARYLVGHPYAKLIYALNEDKNSLVFNRIALKGHDTKTKFSVGQIITILNVVLFGNEEHWTLQNDDKYSKLVVSMKYAEALEKTNDFFHWFFSVFGDNSLKNPQAYKAKTSFSIVALYSRIAKTGIFKSASAAVKLSAVSKMQNFVFTQDWDRIGDAARLNMLINHWNSKRTKYRVEY